MLKSTKLQLRAKMTKKLLNAKTKQWLKVNNIKKVHKDNIT